MIILEYDPLDHKEAEAKVLAKTLVNTLTPLLKEGVTLESFIMASRFSKSWEG